MARRSSSYDDGHQDGRAGFVQHSSNRDYVHGYRYGRQEYEYWNSPSAFDEALEGFQGHSETGELGIGSVVGIALFWVLLWAPIGLFFGNESTLYKVVFWGGLGFVVLVFVCWLANILTDDSEKYKRGHKK